MIKNRITNSAAVEMLWLFATASVAIIIAATMGWEIPSQLIDIHLFDTYILIPAEYVVIALFLLLSFILFFAKEWRKGFSGDLSNCIIIISGLAWVLILSILIFQLPLLYGMTFYPPLSELEGQTGHETHAMKYILLAIQFLFISALLFVMYKWGKSRAR
jgi:heme/copper-type cytochrome/quinol oxidase subunit 1